ncbi:hypothetical protein [Ralstonia sp. 24A2]|uniref:hypothetical protein n=1 Tax=Ralstonia sp. 24A2 TaxID=3447364 RepID=UPI003F6964E7
MEVLCAFIDLKEDGQRGFNCALNDYLLASPAQRRKLAQLWRESIQQGATQYEAQDSS